MNCAPRWRRPWAEQQAQARLAGLRSSGRTARRRAGAGGRHGARGPGAEPGAGPATGGPGFYSAAQLDEARRAVDVARAQRAARAPRCRPMPMQRHRCGAGPGAAGRWPAPPHSGCAGPPGAGQLLRARRCARAVRAGGARADRAARQGLAEPGAGRPHPAGGPGGRAFSGAAAAGQKAAVVADAFAGQRFAARVLSIAPAVDAQRGAIEVKFALEQQAALPFCAKT
jgi:HlyD family secretion protein